jgi:hypothetical protein
MAYRTFAQKEITMTKKYLLEAIKEAVKVLKEK